MNLTDDERKSIIEYRFEKFVKEGTLDREQAHVYMRLFEMRQSGDYDDCFDHTEEDVLPYIDKTQQLIRHLKEL